MGLFGKKKQEEPEIEEELLDENEAAEEEEEVTDTEAEDEAELDAEADDGDDELDEDDDEDEPKVELNAEDRFKDRCAKLSQCVRAMFPQQLLNGFYYAELQADGYIDDFCCYTTKGERLERDEIPKRCGMSDPEMIAREERLEQAFFLFRRAAIEFTEKPCNGVTVSLLPNGQAKLDIITTELVEGEEDMRYGAFRKLVDMGDPKYMPPKISEEKMAVIRQKSDPIYRELGQSFYNFIPGNEFRVAFFYAEFSERGVFYHYRCVVNNGSVLDGDAMFEHFHISLDQTEERRNEVVANMMRFRQVFADEGERPCTAMTLTMTGEGRFSMQLGYGINDEEGEQSRLEIWKKKFTGEGYPPVKHESREDMMKKLAEAEIDPELREQVNSIYMELGTEFYSYLPDVEYNRTYFLAEFSEDGVFTYQRMILSDGETVEGDDMFAKFDMDTEQAENDRSKIIELIDNIRELIINDGETPFTSMTLSVSDKGEFRTFMSFAPVDAADRDARLEEWRKHYNGGEIS